LSSRTIETPCRHVNAVYNVYETADRENQAMSTPRPKDQPFLNIVHRKTLSSGLPRVLPRSTGPYVGDSHAPDPGDFNVWDCLFPSTCVSNACARQCLSRSSERPRAQTSSILSSCPEVILCSRLQTRNRR